MYCWTAQFSMLKYRLTSSKTLRSHIFSLAVKQNSSRCRLFLMTSFFFLPEKRTKRGNFTLCQLKNKRGILLSLLVLGPSYMEMREKLFVEVESNKIYTLLSGFLNITQGPFMRRVEWIARDSLVFFMFFFFLVLKSLLFFFSDDFFFIYVAVPHTLHFTRQL